MPRKIYDSEVRQFFNSFNVDQIRTIKHREYATIEVTGLNLKTYVAEWGYDANNDGGYKIKRAK